MTWVKKVLKGDRIGVHEWCDSNGLKEGDYVLVTTYPKYLQITPITFQEKSK